MYSAAVIHSVQILTQTVYQPTPMSFSPSVVELVQRVRSIAEYMLAREKITWKKVYEYVIGHSSSFYVFLCHSSISSNERKGFQGPGKESER